MKYETVRQVLAPIFRSRVRLVTDTPTLPDGPFIVATNHIDFLDGFYLGAALLQLTGRRLFVLTKTNNYGWTRATIPIDESKPGHALDKAIEVLQGGGVIMNFVEGERNHTNTLLPGKTGTVRLALAAGVPIVPMGILGTQPHTYFAGSVYEFLQRRPGMTVHVGEPWQVPAPAAVTNEALHELTHQLMKRLAPLCGKVAASPTTPHSVE